METPLRRRRLSSSKFPHRPDADLLGCICLMMHDEEECAWGCRVYGRSFRPDQSLHRVVLPVIERRDADMTKLAWDAVNAYENVNEGVEIRYLEAWSDGRIIVWAK